MTRSIKPLKPKTMKPVKTFLPPKPQLALCVIFREDIEHLAKLLASVKNCFDTYSFTDTGSTDGSRALVESFLKFHPGKLTNFEWVDDFAAARNFNFAQVDARWKMFLDADDVLVGGETLRKTLDNAECNPNLRGIFVAYDYDLLEELQTLRLVKWSDDWSFSDAIHERLVAKSDPGASGFAQVDKKQIHVLHRRKTEAMKVKALLRNSVIAKREYAVVTDPEYKARLARTISMENKMNGDLDGAEPYLLEVGQGYPALPEGKQAFADLSRIYSARDDLDTALRYAKKAGPSYEAIVHHARGEHKLCIQRQTAASVMPQQTTHEGFLFEQVVAPMCMADSAYRLDYPAAAIERVISGIRADLRVHESVGEATVALRRGIDRITILVPGTPQPFDGSSTDAMLGGSEEAVVYLSRELVRQGRNVRIYGTLPPLTLPGIDKDGVEYRPFSDFKLHDEHGTLVIWRSVGLLHQLLEHQTALSEARKAGDEKAILPSGIGRASLWLHDQSTGVEPVLNGKLLSAIDSVIVLSDHHQRCIERGLPKDHKVKFAKLSNGVVGSDMRNRHVKRDPNRVVYSSCPSRGLRVLLDAWPEIKAACPDAYLDIYYDWAGVQNNQPALYADIVARYEAVKHLDVKHHGGVGHAELHDALAGANIWAYSHYESTDVETFAISAVKATALGATVITAPNGALPEVAPDSCFVEDVGDYVEAVIAHLDYPVSDNDRADKAETILERFDWVSVAERFSAEWTVNRQSDPVP